MVAGRLANMRQGARTDIASIEAMSQPDAAKALNVTRHAGLSARCANWRTSRPEAAKALSVSRRSVQQSSCSGSPLHCQRQQRLSHQAQAKAQKATEFGIDLPQLEQSLLVGEVKRPSRFA
jgi:hypothetical protein